MDTFISEVERLEQFDKQFRGYNIVEVNDRIQELKQEIEKQKEVIQSMEEEMTDLKEQNTLLTKKISVHEKTNEEIARLALKESMEYVRGLSKDMDTFKQEAIDFRANVVKMSKEMLETIDKSEIFSLIKEEQENKYNDKDSL